MADYDGAAIRYVDRVTGKTDKPFLKGNNDSAYPRGRMFARGDVIYSYGDHFEIARAIRDKAGALVAFLINGDTWGPTTGKQQRAVREAIKRSGVEFVIIPFSALDSSGLSRDTIRLVDSLPDRNIQHTDVRWEFPKGAVWQNDVEVDEYGTREQHDRFGRVWVERFPDPNYANMPRYRLPYNGLQWKLMTKLHREDERRRDKHGVTVGRVDHIERRLYTSKVAAKRGLTEWNAHLGPVWEVEPQPDGRTKYSRTWTQHLLGESLITAEVPYTKLVRCPDCKGSGLAPEAYQEAWEVQRYESALKRHGVDVAEYPGLVAKYTEGGMPTPYWLREPVAPAEPRWHSECSRCGGRKRLGVPAKRTAYFLSGFDHNEWPRVSYFFCELPPKVKPTTVEEAYEVLKPAAVKLAEQMDRVVKRQGDIFAIELATTTRAQLKAQGATFAKGAYVFSTNHKATEVALLKDGTTIARGTLTHAPAGRRPDHKRVGLGTTWHVLAKNTVPLAK